MSTSVRRPHGLLCSLVAVLAVLAVLAPPAAQAQSTRSCASADLRYPFRPGGPKTFGVFTLQVTGGTCATAHRVARAWMREFERRIRRPGRLRLPRSVAGFRFTTLSPDEAQSYRERGRRGATVIRFRYRVPNG